MGTMMEKKKKKKKVARTLLPSYKFVKRKDTKRR
jgi:transcription antitermination factor NusG